MNGISLSDPGYLEFKRGSEIIKFPKIAFQNIHNPRGIAEIINGFTVGSLQEPDDFRSPIIPNEAESERLRYEYGQFAPTLIKSGRGGECAVSDVLFVKSNDGSGITYGTLNERLESDNQDYMVGSGAISLYLVINGVPRKVATNNETKAKFPKYFVFKGKSNDSKIRTTKLYLVRDANKLLDTLLEQ